MKQSLFCTAFTVFLTASPLTLAQQTETRSRSENNPPFAEKIQLHGVNNAGKINEHFYRGAQPNRDAMQSLKQLGVTTIVDLRGEKHDESENEKKQAEKLGMKFLLIPGDGWASPTDAQLAEFFRAITQRPQQTIFIHCWLGADRTGVFVAAYRMTFDHWTPEQALAEMHDYHFNSLWHPSMIEYVKNFPQRLATAEALSEYRSGPSGSSSASTSAH